MSWRRKLALALCPSLGTELGTLQGDKLYLQTSLQVWGEQFVNRVAQYKAVSEAQLLIAHNFQQAIYQIHADTDRLWSDAFPLLPMEQRKRHLKIFGFPVASKVEGEPVPLANPAETPEDRSKYD